MNAAVRELWRGRVWRIFPVRLAERRPDGSALLWSPPGAQVLRPFAAGRELRIPGDEDWTLEVRPSRWEEVALVTPGSRFTVWHFFAEGRLRNWYVNFERESTWNGACFDLVDEKLDLVVAPDGAVRWKDEDELEAAPHVDTGELRERAGQVVAAPPWPTGLEGFRPDPGWPRPELPVAWDVAPLETPRLRLVPLTTIDEQAYAGVVGPAVSGAVAADSERRWRDRGLGGWSILDGAGFAGAIELRAHPDAAEVEIGWALAPDRRGRGLATEAAAAAIADAWARTGAGRLVAHVEPGNTPSLRLAERLGFRACGTAVDRGAAVDVLELRRPC